MSGSGKRSDDMEKKKWAHVWILPALGTFANYTRETYTNTGWKSIKNSLQETSKSVNRNIKLKKEFHHVSIFLNKFRTKVTINTYLQLDNICKTTTRITIMPLYNSVECQRSSPVLHSLTSDPHGLQL